MQHFDAKLSYLEAEREQFDDAKQLLKIDRQTQSKRRFLHLNLISTIQHLVDTS